MQLWLVTSSVFLRASESRWVVCNYEPPRLSKLKKVLDYVSTHGFSKIMCLHLWGSNHWWWCRSGNRWCTGAGIFPGQESALCQETGQGPQNHQAHTHPCPRNKACPPCGSHDENANNKLHTHGGKNRDNAAGSIAACSASLYTASRASSL